MYSHQRDFRIMDFKGWEVYFLFGHLVVNPNVEFSRGSILSDVIFFSFYYLDGIENGFAIDKFVINRTSTIKIKMKTNCKFSY